MNVTEWQNIHYLEHPMEVLKCLKFPPLILVPWACADKYNHVQMNFFATVTEGVAHGVHKVVSRSSFRL